METVIDPKSNSIVEKKHDNSINTIHKHNCITLAVENQNVSLILPFISGSIKTITEAVINHNIFDSGCYLYPLKQNANINCIGLECKDCPFNQIPNSKANTLRWISNSIFVNNPTIDIKVDIVKALKILDPTIIWAALNKYGITSLDDEHLYTLATRYQNLFDADNIPTVGAINWLRNAMNSDTGNLILTDTKKESSDILTPEINYKDVFNNTYPVVDDIYKPVIELN